MSVLSRLLRVGSIAQSMSVYLPAAALQLIFGMGRVLFFTYILQEDSGEMGIWGTGGMIFIIGAPLMCLGTNHSLVRYVSFYEARGELLKFFRLTRKMVFGLVAFFLILGLLGSSVLLRKIVYPNLTGEPSEYQWHVCLAILGNVAMMSLYVNMLSFMYGLRVYRLASVVELLFGTLFTGSVIVWLLFAPSALTILLAHAASLLVMFVIGMWLLSRGVHEISGQVEALEQAARSVKELEASPSPGTYDESNSETLSIPTPIEDDEEPIDATDNATAGLVKLIRFGLVGMLGAFVWQVVGYVSFWLTKKWYGDQSASSFYVMMRLAQPMLTLATAAWAVLFSHVAKRWESDDRDGAMFVLETAYKAISLTMMTFTVLVYVTSPWWINLVGPTYRDDVGYLSGLLTMFVTISSMTLLTITAKLHERPVIIAIAALAGIGLNVILAALWMPEMGPVGAARAAGVGMYFGGGLVMLVYLLATGVKLADSTYFVIGMPILLLLPIKIIGTIWAVVLPISIFSPWLFSDRQKGVLLHVVNRWWEMARGVLKCN